ncbi:MAG: response regulator [Pyrinomonadaceae bacterium]
MAKTEGKIRILLAEDHGTVREGIKLLINSQDDMEVVGEVDNGEEAIRKAGELSPDLIVMDISMPEMNGLAAKKKLRQSSAVKILTLTRHTNDGYLHELIRAGVNGYVLKQSAPTELISAIRAVNAGKSFVDPALTAKVMSGYAGKAQMPRGEGSKSLTDRESEILRLIAWGHSNKEIAYKLDLSVKTVEAHKANTMRKLGITSRIDIVRYAILVGWLREE